MEGSTRPPLVYINNSTGIEELLYNRRTLHIVNIVIILKSLDAFFAIIFSFNLD